MGHLIFSLIALLLLAALSVTLACGLSVLCSFLAVLVQQFLRYRGRGDATQSIHRLRRDGDYDGNTASHWPFEPLIPMRLED